MRKKRAGPEENLSGAGAGSIASVAAGSGRLFFLAKAGEGAKTSANRQANSTGLDPPHPDDDTRTQHLTPLPGRGLLGAFHPEISVFVTV